jgi:hypothetical protein
MHIAGMAAVGVAVVAADTMVVGTIITVDGSKHFQ